MKIFRIKPPKFRVGRYILNEYELRKLMLSVALGLNEPGTTVIDCSNSMKATINADGWLSNPLESMGIASEITLQSIKIKRDAEKKAAAIAATE